MTSIIKQDISAVFELENVEDGEKVGEFLMLTYMRRSSSKMAFLKPEEFNIEMIRRSWKINIGE